MVHLFLSLAFSTICWFQLGSSMVEFYMSKEEVKRLFNKEAQFDYVTNGKVNIHAVNYPTPIFVWFNITQLHFHWKSSAVEDIFYWITFKVDKPSILIEPILVKTKAEGVLPRKDEPLSINLKCANAERGVDVTVQINVTYTWPSTLNKTNLIFTRRKFCSSHFSPNLVAKDGNTSAKEIPSAELVKDLNAERAEAYAYYYGSFGSAGNIFYAAIGCIFGFVIVVASLVVMYFVRKKPEGYEPASTAPVVEQTAANRAHRVFPADLRADENDYQTRYRRNSGGSKYSGGGGGGATSLSMYRSIDQQQNRPVSVAEPSTNAILVFEPKEVDVDYLMENLAVERQRIRTVNLELEGTFGEMFFGYLFEHEDDEEAEDVVIKTVKGGSSDAQVSKFLSEALAFSLLSRHPNVSCVLATCAEFPPLLCYSHRGYGNLKKFLTRCRGAEASHSLVTQDLVHMALQIIRGVVHLHDNGILHRDIATRNCLIAEDLSVQVCDTGLSRDLFSQDYHCLGDNENRPVKWLAIESLEKREFSSASDVWAFGVTLWELITLAQQPYVDVDPFEMHSYLSEDNRLQQPYNCPDTMYMLMYCCWNNHPQARPAFANLLKALGDFCAELNQFV